MKSINEHYQKMLGHYSIQKMTSILKRFWPSCNRQEFNNDREEIEDILKPIILTATLFGIIPISIKFSNKKQMYVALPKSIYLNIFRCITFILLNITFFTVHMYLLYTLAESPNFANLPKRINYIFENLNCLIVCVTVYVSGFLNRYNYLKILNRILCAWTKMPPSYEGQTILNKIFVKSYIILTGVVIVLLLHIYLNSYQDILWMLVIAMCLSLPQTIQFVFHAFYAVQVKLLAAVLCRITEHCKLPTQSPSIIEVRPKQRYLTIMEMKRLYIEVYEIKLIIEQAFKAPVIYSLLQSFHSLIAESYFIIYGLLYLKNISTYFICSCAVWILCQIIKVYSLSYSGNLLKLEASRFAEALVALPTEAQNIRWFMEVQNLSRLLKYLPMDINMYGFFSLDAALIFQVLASALTYLIILTQFAVE